MSDSRSYTTVDDWVALNPEVTHTEFRVYTLIKGNLRHGPGAIPQTGFRATAAWVAKVSGGLFSVSTVHRAVQGLAAKGIIHRLNNPNTNGEGAEFEFVVHPEAGYAGHESIMARAAEVAKTATRGISFGTVELTGNPSNGLPKKAEVTPSESMGMDEAEISFPGEPDIDDLDFGSLEEPDPEPAPAVPPTGQMSELAEALESATAGMTEPKLRLMSGQCQRIAEKASPLLALGWEPTALARRLAAELNPHIRLPEQLLISKIPDMGAPPKAKGRVMGEAVDSISEKGVPMKQAYSVIPRREGRKVISPEEQEKVRKMQQEYAERNHKSLRNL